MASFKGSICFNASHSIPIILTTEQSIDSYIVGNIVGKFYRLYSSS